MLKQVLREFYKLNEITSSEEMLTEEERKLRNNGTVFVHGIMQKCNELNGNGRIYERRILEREVENYQKLISENRALGELDHPDDSVINLKNVSHAVKKMWWEGNNVMGKVQILDTPSGNILKSLINNGITLGISSRGLGSTRKEGDKTIVEDDFMLICFDFVQEPSTPGAFMTMQESKNLKYPLTKADKLNRLLNDIGVK